MKWGIIATGSIAGAFAYSLQECEGAEIAAVASRSLDSAQRFAHERGAARAYGSYSELFADPDVEVVYIATPHHLHHSVTLEALRAGKHVVCEKPLALNARQAEEMAATARDAGLLLLEAVWMRFIPAIETLRSWIAEGRIGEVRVIDAAFSFELPFDPEHRLFNPELGGGSLLDVGIYPLSFTTMLLGFPDRIQTSAVLGETGVDEAVTYSLQYESGAQAQLYSGIRLRRPVEATIYGSEGSIHVPHMFLRSDRLVLQSGDGDPVVHEIPYRANGYIHEIEAVQDALRDGRLDLAQQTLDESLQMMRLMDQLRAEWGLVYPGE